MSSGPGVKLKSALRKNPKPSGSTSSTPSASIRVSDFCACRMWKMRSCLRSAPGASMLRSFASLASWRIFISLSSDRFICCFRRARAARILCGSASQHASRAARTGFTGGGWNDAQCKDAARRLSNLSSTCRPAPVGFAAEEGWMPLRRACPFAVLVLLACGGGGPSRPPVASISLIPSTATPLTSLGATLQVTATALDTQGAPIPGVGIAYTSSDAAIATVSQVGLITAVANGAATIHASAEGKEATIAVTVAQVVAHVLLTPLSIRVPAGETPLFHASAVDARNHLVVGAPPPSWTTTDLALATIGTDGRATVSAGAPDGATVSAVATVGTVSSAAGGLMTVDHTALYVETITINPSSVATFASVGQTVQLAATASN